MNTNFGVGKNRKERERGEAGSKWQGFYLQFEVVCVAEKEPSCLPQHSLKSVLPTQACVNQVLWASWFWRNLVEGSESLIHSTGGGLMIYKPN